MSHYGTEAGFEAYCIQMGYTPTEGDVDPALERGTMWLDSTYGMRYPGLPTDPAQELGWPRTNAINCRGYRYPPDEIPGEIERATYEASLRELANPGSLMPDVTAGKVYKSVAVSGAVSVTYADEGGVVQSQMPTITVVDNMLSCLLGGNTTGGQVTGRTVVKWPKRS